ncbi:hypothetical protein E4U34_006218 [Claviceps purpurea]|nr:hypothetical protein E4U34_006218 [Claviceps purpurea]
MLNSRHSELATFRSVDIRILRDILMVGHFSWQEGPKCTIDAYSASSAETNEERICTTCCVHGHVGTDETDETDETAVSDGKLDGHWDDRTAGLAQMWEETRPEAQSSICYGAE